MTSAGNSGGGQRALALQLAALAALTPLAIDAYLPALPAMADDLDAPIQQIELSISTYFFGYACGQLIGALFSDRIGRRPPILFGLLLFALASALIIVSTDAQQLLPLRFIQAFGGGCAVVNTAAIVRDLYEERDSASMLAQIALIMMCAPLLAPALGAVVLLAFDWRMIFALLGGYALLLLGVLYRRLPETVGQETRSRGGFTGVLAVYRQVFTNPQALGYMLGSSFAAGCMFVFLSDASFAYMTYFGVSASLFPVLFGANIVSMMLLTQLNRRLLRSTTPQRMIFAGLLLQVTASLAFAVYVLLAQPQLAIVVVFVMLAVGANGLIVSNSQACFLAFFATGSGKANSLFTTAGFAVGAGLGAVFGLLHDGTLMTLAYGMFASALIGLVANRSLTTSK